MHCWYGGTWRTWNKTWWYKEKEKEHTHNRKKRKTHTRIRIREVSCGKIRHGLSDGHRKERERGDRKERGRERERERDWLTDWLTHTDQSLRHCPWIFLFDRTGLQAVPLQHLLQTFLLIRNGVVPTIQAVKLCMYTFATMLTKETRPNFPFSDKWNHVVLYIVQLWKQNRQKWMNINTSKGHPKNDSTIWHRHTKCTVGRGLMVCSLFSHIFAMHNDIIYFFYYTKSCEVDY